MRLLTYRAHSSPALGILRGSEIVPLTGLSMLELIEQGKNGLDYARQANGIPIPLDEVTLLAPIPVPRRNIFCLGWNYLEHTEESSRARGKPIKVPDRPVFFTKLTTAVTGPYADIPCDPRVSEQIDWEVELAVVIGQGGKNIPAGRALEHVFGYTVVNDVSARDVQIGHGGQFFKGKSLDGFCPMGPWIVTADEIPEPHALALRSRVNGSIKQDSSTAQMFFKIPQIIEWLSLGLTLLPGDIIATGTPAGVGFARTPPEFLKPGDVVECEVEQVGLIRNRVALAAAE